MPQAPVFQRPVSIGLPPTQPQGARITSPITLVTNNGGTSQVWTTDTMDLVMEDAEGVINNVQTMYVDASLLTAVAVLTFPETGQRILIQPYTQGYYPIAVGQQGQVQFQGISATIDMGNSYITLQFLNVPIPPCIWNAQINPAGCYAQTVANAGDSQITLTFLPDLTEIVGFDVTGTGATAAGDATVKVTFAMAKSSSAQTLVWDFYVPVLGEGSVNFSKQFDPPLLMITDADIVWTVSAMGAGQTAAYFTVYYKVYST